MRSVRAEVNVTPMIDVMLVLLIIAMVLMPMANRAVDTKVPAKATDEPPQPAPAAIVVTVGPRLALNGQELEGLSDLRLKLEAALAARNDRTVFVGSDGDVTYGRVVEAMDTARDAGAERLGILTGRDQPAPSRTTRNP
jgi:biopolymer transport protein ExbD